MKTPPEFIPAGGNNNFVRVIALILIVAVGIYFARNMNSQPSLSSQFDLRQEEALEAMNKAIDRCQAEYRYGQLKTYRQTAECATPHIIEAFHDAGFPYMDLVQSFTEERVQLAIKLDKNQITQDEALEEDKKFLARLRDEAYVRRKAKTP